MWIEIFKTGRFRDSNGIERSYSEEDLDNIVERFNSEATANSYSAPIVKGHPATDDPSHGWIQRLVRRGRILLAKVKDLSKEVIEDVRSGRYRKVSISLYPDRLLRHVGLLGASQPAVRGLRELEFSEEAPEFSLIADFSDEDTSSAETALIAENAELKEKIVQLEQQILLRNCRNYAENFFKSNKFLAANDTQIELLANLLYTDSQTNDFSERSALLSFVESLRPSFLLEPLRVEPEIEFVSPNFDGKNINEDKLELHNSALKLMKLDSSLCYEQAIENVINNLNSSIN